MILNHYHSNYSFEIGNIFFEKFEYSDIKEAYIKADINIKRYSQSYMLNISIVGEIYNFLCDLCAEKITIPIEKKTSFILEENPHDLNSNDEIIYINPNQRVLNIKQILFEIITLSIPNKRVHKNDEHSKCDQKMLKTIKKYIISEKTTNSIQK